MSDALSFIASGQRSHLVHECRRLAFFGRREARMQTFLGVIRRDISTPHLELVLVSNRYRHSTRVHQTSGGLNETAATASDGKEPVDTFLEIAEILCIASSAILVIVFAVYSSAWNSHTVPASGFLVPKWNYLANRVISWQLVLLVGAVAIGALIRSRQCSSVGSSDDRGSTPIESLEKLEEDVRSLATIVRALSRQLEKLGIRFRVTRRSVRDPMAETAALVQKNSEATQALAVREDILQKELVEVQKVLLAMQEQQRKQLELILAIAVACRPRERSQESVTQEGTVDMP